MFSEMFDKFMKTCVVQQILTKTHTIVPCYDLYETIFAFLPGERWQWYSDKGWERFSGWELWIGIGDLEFFRIRQGRFLDEKAKKILKKKPKYFWAMLERGVTNILALRRAGERLHPLYGSELLMELWEFVGISQFRLHISSLMQDCES